MPKYFTLSWRNSMISECATIRDALSAISKCGAMMSCVVNDNDRLIGILTDSDIRRALLNGAMLESPIAEFINRSPIVSDVAQSDESLAELASKFGVREMPLIDQNSRLCDIYVVGLHSQRQVSEEVTNPFGLRADVQLAVRPNAMMILAGGLGTRLRSIVSDKPKPLAVVGERPVLETLILRAASQGIRKFYVSVNYLAEQIETHLTSEVYAGLNIKVIREKDRLGTAGSISLIEDKLNEPLVVANADILTTASLDQMIRQHDRSQSYVTCAVRPYKHRIPFGVFVIQDSQITGLQEKPEAIFTVNAGLYVLSPEAVKDVPSGKFFDMPDLMELGLKSKKLISPFMLHEYWIDIGKPDDFHKANAEFHLHFGQK